MKSIDIVSKIVAREGEAKASPSKGIQSINLSDYLLKSVWDKVFEIRTDSQGIEYIFGKLPMVTQYGITMYSGDGVDIPSLASGLPFDGRTIWYNPETNQIEVIGGTGGGSGEGVSNFWDLSGIPSWITNSKPKYTYSEIEGTPDLTKYALASQIPSLSGYATESWVTQQNYATKATTLSGYGITDAYTKTNVDDLLKSYVTLGGTQTITGEKNFTGGLKVNGSHIYYDTEKKYWKLEGDLLVTGGVTMYGSDSSFTPSTIMDALLYDDTTLGINSNGQLYVKGGSSGGGLDITALQNYLTQNSYINVTSGDNRYLKLSGGTLTKSSGAPLVINVTEDNDIGIMFAKSSAGKGWVGYDTTRGTYLYNTPSKTYFSIKDDGSLFYSKGTIWHSGNFNPSNYLPLNGNASSATKLQSARTIWGQSFDGTGNVSGNLIGSNFGIYDVGGNPYIEFSSGGMSTLMQMLATGALSLGRSYTHFVITQDGNVGVGIASPSSKLSVYGGVTLDGYFASDSVTKVKDLGSKALVISTNYARTNWGMNLWIEGNGNGYIQQQAFSDSGTTYPLVLQPFGGNVGIGIKYPSAKLHVSGDILASGAMTFYSMRKLKNVVDERGLSLNELSTIKPTRYTWKDGRDNRLHFGGIADDIQQVLPEVVYKTSDGILTMDYGNAAFAVASSLIKPVVDHENRIAILEEENKKLKQEVERLKSA